MSRKAVQVKFVLLAAALVTLAVFVGSEPGVPGCACF
jgi:hypothetical protein